MPRLEREIWPAYRDRGFDVLAVNTSRRTDFAAAIARSANLTFPIGLDIDSEVVRAYRVPGWVYPLNVVIDREGRIAHIDIEEGLDETEAAIADAL